MRIGIVGNEAAKFTTGTEAIARAIIRELLQPEDSIVVSGHCHLGGIDIWAEEEADKLGRRKLIYPPKARSWLSGFRPRNIQIAESSDELHNIVVAEYPPDYRGMRFDYCYHCVGSAPERRKHVKSGGCWTAKYAMQLRKVAVWHIIAFEGFVQEGATSTPWPR